MKKAVVLVHGLMTNSIMMSYLGFKIYLSGYKIYYFNYKTRKYSDKTLKDFDCFLDKIEEKEIYLVGHSMGGLVIRNYLHKESYKEKLTRIKSVITIATPHNQSLVAHKVKESFKWFLGTANEAGLTNSIGSWNSDIPLGCIAGIYKSKWNANLFLLFNKIKVPNDGTVLLEEAILNKSKDSIIIEGSHTGLVFQKNVVKQIVYFFKNCIFEK